MLSNQQQNSTQKYLFKTSDGKLDIDHNFIYFTKARYDSALVFANNFSTIYECDYVIYFLDYCESDAQKRRFANWEMSIVGEIAVESSIIGCERRVTNKEWPYCSFISNSDSQRFEVLEFEFNPFSAFAVH
jgi:hypothetical protein